MPTSRSTQQLTQAPGVFRGIFVPGGRRMPVKKKKREKKKNGEKKKPAKRSVVKTGRKEGKGKSRFQVDIFNEHAMQNAYYTCHSVQDVLKCRGFPWPELQKKKKKGKRK